MSSRTGRRAWTANCIQYIRCGTPARPGTWPSPSLGGLSRRNPVVGERLVAFARLWGRSVPDVSSSPPRQPQRSSVGRCAGFGRTGGRSPAGLVPLRHLWAGGGWPPQELHRGGSAMLLHLLGGQGRLQPVLAQQAFLRSAPPLSRPTLPWETEGWAEPGWVGLLEWVTGLSWEGRHPWKLQLPDLASADSPLSPGGRRPSKKRGLGPVPGGLHLALPPVPQERGGAEETLHPLAEVHLGVAASWGPLPWLLVVCGVAVLPPSYLCKALTSDSTPHGVGRVGDPG